MVYLCPAGNSRTSLLSQLVSVDVLAQLGEYTRPLWTRTHDIHVAQDDIDKLRKLVEPRLAEKISDGRNPRIVLGRPHRTRPCLCVLSHRPEFEDAKRTASNVRFAPVLARRKRPPATIDPNTVLHVEHRPARRDLHRKRDKHHHRTEHYQREYRDEYVEQTVERFGSLSGDDALRLRIARSRIARLRISCLRISCLRIARLRAIG